MKSDLLERKITIDGKRVSIYYRTEREYQQKYKRKLAEAAAAEEARRHVTFRAALEAWQDHHDPTVQHYTRDCYAAPIKDLLAWFGDRDVRELRPRDVQTRLDDMFRQGYAYQTTNLRRLVVNMVYDYAVFNDVTEYNPMTTVSVPRSAPRAGRALPPDDALQKIFASVAQPLGMFFLLAACTGGRRGEILALTKSDVDLTAGAITFSKVLILANDAESYVRPGTKTKAGMRTVPILPALRPLLAAYVANLPGDFLFACDGKPLRKWYFDKQSAKYRAATGLDVTAHQLRHLYATLCYDAGLNDKDAQQLLGHAKSSTPKDIYIHIRESRAAQSAARLGDALNAALTAEAKKQ